MKGKLDVSKQTAAALLCALLVCSTLGHASSRPTGDYLDIDDVVKMIVDSVDENGDDVHIPIEQENLRNRGILLSALQEDEEFIEEGETAAVTSKKEYEHGYQDGYEDAAADVKKKAATSPPSAKDAGNAAGSGDSAHKELEAAREAKNTVVSLMQDVKQEIGNDFTRVSASLENKMAGFEKKVEGEVQNVQAEVNQLKAAQKATAGKAQGQGTLRGMDTIDLAELADRLSEGEEWRHHHRRRHHERRRDDDDDDDEDSDDADYDDDRGRQGRRGRREENGDDLREERRSGRSYRHRRGDDERGEDRDDGDRDDDDDDDREPRRHRRREHSRERRERHERRHRGHVRESEMDEDAHRPASKKHGSSRKHAQVTVPAAKTSPAAAAQSSTLASADKLAKLDSEVISHLDTQEGTSGLQPLSKAENAHGK